MFDGDLSTGIPGLDRILKGLLPGDNVVFQVDAIDDYAAFVPAFCEHALRRGKRLVYFRFADHAPLVPEDSGAEICRPRVEAGFEQFITDVHQRLEESGRDACFVFDSLTSLAERWYSDGMLANFFMLTCPYIYNMESLAYFAILRGAHSSQASSPIADTAQISLDVYRHHGELYIRPIKVQRRYSPTMYMLHNWHGDEFLPVTESSTTAEILTAKSGAGMRSARQRLGVWNRNFLQAEEASQTPQQGEHCGQVAPLPPHLLRMAFSRDQRVLSLLEKHLTLADVLAVWKRMIGTGLIGGKSVGMLLARAILRQADPRWNDLLEVHDSFFVGCDVFYTFLVRNGCWWLRQKQRNPADFLEGVEEARRRIVLGTFPDYIIDEFAEMLDYFGQSPIIVRSSSLLEDNYGNAFAGKYDSVFCANQGPHHKRLEDFIAAVRTIYASTMSEKALRYRAGRGLLDRDEQMSLLVQRVSGTRYHNLFYPQIAGVGLSWNPFVWNKQIDPAAGMLRLVFGLGTRAVDRSDDDYTRVVALNAPQRRPESNADEVRQYSQRRVDVIDLEANQLLSRDFVDVVRNSPGLPIAVFATEDRELRALAENRAAGETFTKVLTFDRLLTETPFVGDMRQALHVLQEAYGCPIDVEFAANFFVRDEYRINLVQCRPLQVATGGEAADLPQRIAYGDRVLEVHSAVIGQSRQERIDRVVYVSPATYGRLPVKQRYQIARLIGQVVHAKGSKAKRMMLVGPGRWGTASPSLGVPVSFSEISTIVALCEVVAMREDLVPDVSLGTHFFNDLVEMDILYLALFPDRPPDFLSPAFFEKSPNRLCELVADAGPWADVVRVIDLPIESTRPAVLRLNANTVEQKVVCYLDHGDGEG